MTNRRGQPPKPLEQHKNEKQSLRYTKDEMELLREAYRLAGSPRTLARWLAEMTLEEARKIVASHKK